MKAPSPARWHRLGADALGVVLLVLGAWATLATLRRPIGIYDEGILLTNAQLLLAGKVPYRDFYSNYPPGAFLVLALVFRVLGPSVLVERGVGVALHLALGAAAGRVGGRLQGRRFAPLAAGLVLLWLAPLGGPPYAWLAALAVALLFCLRWSAAVEMPRRPTVLGAGAALGAVSWFRHDLCVYLVVALGAVVVLQRYAGPGLRLSRRSALQLALAALGTAALFWIPWLGLAGPGRVLGDLVLEQFQHVHPARVLPLPAQLLLLRPPGLPVQLPAFLADVFRAAVLLVLAGPPLALLAAARPKAAGVLASPCLAAVAALSVAVLPQMLGRTDLEHALFALTPALILAALWVTAEAPVAIRVAAALLLCLPPLIGWSDLRTPRRPEAFPELARARGVPDDEAAARRQVLAFVAAHTGPGEPIYVGLLDHRWTILDEMDLYFLADRPGGVRTMQFDPGLTNRADVQATMAAELERSGTRVAVLSARHARSFEPNASREPGATLLDAYLRAHFSVVETSGPYTLVLRTR